VLVGTGQVNQRDEAAEAVDPVELMALAAHCAGEAAVLKAVDAIRVVNLLSWRYATQVFCWVSASVRREHRLATAEWAATILDFEDARDEVGNVVGPRCQAHRLSVQKPAHPVGQRCRHRGRRAKPPVALHNRAAKAHEARVGAVRGRSDLSNADACPQSL
jgi:hypothetical protein